MKGGFNPRGVLMRHYEIVFLVHPDQTEQVGAMLERYTKVIDDGEGTVHRVEDWGRRRLAYTIDKVHKAHYAMMNVEVNQATLDEIENLFRFNDAIIRSLVIRKNAAVTDKSAMMKEVEDERKRDAERDAAREADAKPKQEAKVEEAKAKDAKTEEVASDEKVEETKDAAVETAEKEVE